MKNETGKRGRKHLAVMGFELLTLLAGRAQYW